MASIPIHSKATERHNPLRRGFAVAFIVAAATMAILAGLWGVKMPRDHHVAGPAVVGEVVELQNGAFRVDRLAPEHMAPMQMSNFASSGMSMAMPNMDMAPEGYARFAVDLTLAARGDDSLQFSPDDVQVIGNGMDPAHPVRHTFDMTTIAKGSELSGRLLFDAPENATQLLLVMPGAERQVALLDAAPDGHDHDGHDHDHELEPAAP